MSRKLLKINLYDETKKAFCRVPFCYVEVSLYTRFQRKVKAKKIDIRPHLSRWARVDFNVNLKFETTYAVELLMALLKDYYKAVQPVIYNTRLIDDKGWLQVWVSGNMEKEIS